MLRRASIIGLAVALAFALMPAAGGASLRWTQKAGRYPEAVAVDRAGNTYVSGRATMQNGDTGALLATFGPAGGKRWSRTWSPLASDFAYGTSVAIGDDGTVYWGGVVHPHGCEGGGWFVRAYSSNGRFLWHRDQNGWEGCKVATSLTDLAPGRDILALALTDHGCCADPFADGYVRALDKDSGRPVWRTDIEPAGGVPVLFFDTVTSISVGGLDNIFVGGWAATEKVLDDIPTYDGLAFVHKLSRGGAVLWRRTIRAFAMGRAEVHVSARGDRLVVATIARAGRLYWGGGAPPTAWLGRYSLGGELMWSRTWGKGWRHGSEPSGVSVGPAMDTWVVGTTRDATDRGYDLFARRYASGGKLLQTIQLDGPTRKLWGGGVAAFAAGAAFTGSALTASSESIGRVWVYGPA